MEGNRYDNDTIANQKTTTSGEIIGMMNNTLETGEHINRSISCNVRECKYHAKSEDYCTLDKIQVIKHNDATMSTVEYTDCGSYVYEGQIN